MINEKKKHRSYIPAKDIKGYDEKIYPQAFLRNKKLMDLVKSKTDPISFLLAVVKMQNAGRLHLQRIGAATTREVAALWNDFNSKKIDLALAEQVMVGCINENSNVGTERDHGSSSMLAKGWVHPSGKIYVWNKMSPYHVQYIVQNPRKYRLKEQDIMDHLIARYEDYGVNQPVTSAERVMGELKSGRQDIDRRIEYMVIKKGWCRFVINGDWNDIRGRNFKDLHKCAKVLHDNMPQRFIKGSITTVVIIDQEDGEYNYRNNVELELDQFKSWVGGKKPDPKDVRVRKHTEIGKTMQMFRGHDWDEPAKIYSSNQPDSKGERLSEEGNPFFPEGEKPNFMPAPWLTDPNWSPPPPPPEMEPFEFNPNLELDFEPPISDQRPKYTSPFHGPQPGWLDGYEWSPYVHPDPFNPPDLDQDYNPWEEQEKEKYRRGWRFESKTPSFKKWLAEKSSKAEIEGAMEWWHGEITASDKRQRAAMGYGRPENIRELIKRPIPMLKYHVKMYNAYLDKYGPFDEVPSKLEI